MITITPTNFISTFRVNTAYYYLWNYYKYFYIFIAYNPSQPLHWNIYEGGAPFYGHLPSQVEIPISSNGPGIFRAGHL